ncbi:MAG: nucleoside triphosphate pyrophosphohydrolase [Ilumatobacteraceae bacterium]
MLVAHCHADWVLSDIKLAVEGADGDEPVVILQRLGSPDEAVVHTTWADLDRTVEADHLTSIYLPRLASPVGQELIRFREIVRRLRNECPWDRKQTHQSLAKYAIEETYELVDAIGELGDEGAGDDELVGELGDVLLQVFLHSAIAEQDGRFSLAEVADEISEKMIRRHPHVFGEVVVDDEHGVASNWQDIKAAERLAAGKPDVVDPLAEVSNGLPGLLYAKEVSAAAAKLGFDWDEPRDVLHKIAEELDETREVYEDDVRLADELGDLLLAVANLARLRKVDPEVAVRHATNKFRRRFAHVVRLADERGIDMTAVDEAALDVLWLEAKALTAGS